MEWQFSLDNINEVANSFWQVLNTHTVVAFHGQMGAGKTTFIHALCDAKEVKDVVGSPTFSIINEYVFSKNGNEGKIYHIDLYRLKDEQEAIQAGVEDCLYSDHISFVEWPDKAPGLFPDNTIHAYIEAVDSQTRKLKIANI
ncbi:MAG TPA: tRNA (adenosine(37)-N6)-threonylcarbamoyltransferase complex ATPase subunit type 1 TsaE [Chitinophagaceae bacterium]